MSWGTFGITSTYEHNKFVDQVQDFKDKALPPLEVYGESIQKLAHEDLIEARRDNDEAKIERAIAVKVMSAEATKDIAELEKMELHKIEEPPFDWAALIQMILSAMGVGGIAAPLLAMKNSRIRKKAIEFAQSTEVNDVKDLT